MTDFVPTFWNTLTQHNAGSRTSRISGGQVAYKKRGSDWLTVNNAVSSDLTATEFPGNVQFPVNAQDWADIHLNGEYSAKRQTLEGDWHNPEDEFVMRLRAECPANSTGIIHPDKPWQVIYYNAFGPGVNLIYGIWQGRTARFEHVIEIAEMPPGDSEYLTYNFYLQSNDASAFVGSGHNQRPWAGNSGDRATVQGFSVFLAKGSDSATPRGSVLRAPVCWWTNSDGTLVRKNVRVDFEIQPDGETVKATKYVRRTDIAEALVQGSVYRADVTFNPDANPEATTMDGYTFRQGPSDGSHEWEDLIVGAGTASSDVWDIKGGPHAAAWTGANVFYQLERAWYGFDTSSIGSGQQVDSASLTLSRYNTSTSNNAWDSVAMNVYEAIPASATAIATSDHNNMGTAKFSDTGVTYGTLRGAAQKSKHSWTFNATGRSGVDMEGLTQIGVAWEDDRAQTAVPDPPANYTYEVNFYAAEFTGTAEDPLLTVTYSAASSGSPHNYYQNIQRAS